MDDYRPFGIYVQGWIFTDIILMMSTTILVMMIMDGYIPISW